MSEIGVIGLGNAGRPLATRLLKKGYALLELNERAAGVEVLRALVEKFPGTEEAKWAQARLERLGE